MKKVSKIQKDRDDEVGSINSETSKIKEDLKN
jgi:hypothetical protein